MSTEDNNNYGKLSGLDKGFLVVVSLGMTTVGITLLHTMLDRMEQIQECIDACLEQQLHIPQKVSLYTLPQNSQYPYSPLVNVQDQLRGTKYLGKSDHSDPVQSQKEHSTN